MNLRARRKPNYGHLHLNQATTKPSDYNKLHPNLEHTVLTQYSVKKGLKEFGEAGAEAVVKEMEQLDKRAVIEPAHVNMLTPQEKKGPSNISCF